MARKINTKIKTGPKAKDITKPWMRQFFECKNIDPDTMEKPYSKADFIRKPNFKTIPFPGDSDVNKDKHKQKTN